MPSTSPKQHRFIEAIAHSPSFAAKVKVPQSVGKDFAKADDKAGITKHPTSPPPAPMLGAPKARKASVLPARTDHMRSRSAAGLTQDAIGKEFGKHRTTVGRALRQGYVKT